MKPLLLAAAVLLIATTARAQFSKGTIEMSMLATAGSLDETVKWEYSYEGMNMSDEDSETRKYAYVAFTPGYYLLDHLSLELELGMRAIEGARPVHSGVANLSYTYPIRRSWVAPYLRAGAGLANALSVPGFMDLASVTRLNDYDVTILQAGAGVKLRTGPSGIVRIEVNYRHQSYSWEGEVSKSDHSLGTIALLVGVGVLI
mgnify:CR=1 FL=1